MLKQRIITRTIWILSFVSLFTDVASEMLYPVMPVYLRSIGFSVIFIGVLEGVAEATAGLSKGYFGKLSDNMGRRLPFVQIGYALSAITKPMMAAFAYPLWIFAARSLDRLGKGIRTGARDAMLSDETTPEHKGKVFGFHRSMDTFGAVIGPLAALLFLRFYPGSYRQLFLWAFIPGACAIAITLFIREKRKRTVPEVIVKKTRFLDFIQYWKKGSPAYRKLVIGLLVFALFNSSDVFLLLQVKQSGASDATVIGTYVFYNLIYALTAYPLGIIADKLGLKKIFIAGLIIFSMVYAGMAFSNTRSVFLILFALYGIYAASTEGIAKAWITNVCRKEDTATAIGTFTAFQSIATLAASSLTGLLWFYTSPLVAFGTTAISAMAVAMYFIFMKAPEVISPDK